MRVEETQSRPPTSDNDRFDSPKKMYAWSTIRVLVLAAAVGLSTAAEAKSTDDLNENAILSLLTPKVIFVTSERYTGDLVSAADALGYVALDGLDAADFICQYHAEDAGLKGTYKAVLSSSWENANARISKSLGPYNLVDGTPVAGSFAELFSTRDGNEYTTPPLPPIHLIEAVRRTETGQDIQGGGPDWYFQAWTGSDPDGSLKLSGNPGPGIGSELPIVTSCDDWTSSLPEDDCTNLVQASPTGYCGVAGEALSRNSTWLNSEIAGCNNQRRLYCAEQ